MLCGGTVKRVMAMLLVVLRVFICLISNIEGETKREVWIDVFKCTRV